MNVRVIVEKWGNHVKGDVIENMPESTALACINHKVVEDADAPAKEPKAPKTENPAKKQ